MSHASQSDDRTSTCRIVVEAFFAAFVPPIAVLLTDGCDKHFCISLLLTLLGWLPGVIHAVWRITEQIRAEKERIDAKKELKAGDSVV